MDKLHPTGAGICAAQVELTWNFQGNAPPQQSIAEMCQRKGVGGKDYQRQGFVTVTYSAAQTFIREAGAS